MTETEEFETRLLECMLDINALLPAMGRRYANAVITAALAEHVGLGLRTLLRKEACTVPQAETLIAHIQEAAMARMLGPEARGEPATSLGRPGP